MLVPENGSVVIIMYMLECMMLVVECSVDSTEIRSVVECSVDSTEIRSVELVEAVIVSGSKVEI